jgi:2-polyprenyl-3-methyl-5-hydroxy-6-metoxy-1,4-benzoquinol methylase
MSQLAVRVLEEEVMDQPGLDAAEHCQALAGLRRVNWWSATDRILWRGLQRLAGTAGLSGLRVLDLASGGGDVPLRLVRRARRAGDSLTVHGCDRSATAIEFARRQAENWGLPDVRFERLDVLNDPLPEGYDVIACTLFLHHLTDEQGMLLLRRMASAARLGILIDDLCRCPIGHALAWLGCHLLSRSPMVHVDGPLSVRAAFRKEEVLQLAEQAGLSGVFIEHHWPQRFLLRWKRP